MIAVATNAALAGLYLALTVGGAFSEMSAFTQWLVPFCTGVHATLALIHVAMWLRDRDTSSPSHTEAGE